MRVLQAYSGAIIQPNFFSKKILETCYAKEFCFVRLAKYGTANKQGGLVPGGLEGNNGRQACYFALVNPVDKNPDSKHKAYKTFEASPRRGLRCGDRGSAKGEFRVLPNPQRLRHLLQHDPQGVHQKGHPHHGQGRDIRQDARRGWTHTSNRSPWKNQGYINFRACRKKILCSRKHCARPQNQSPQTKWPFASNN